MSYEFSDTDGKLISRVGLRLQIQAIFLIIAGVGGIIYSAINFATADQTIILIYLIQSIVEIVIGVFLIRVPPSFTKVDETQGEDVDVLMGGLVSMDSAFRVVWIALVLNLGLDVVLIVLSGG